MLKRSSWRDACALLDRCPRGQSGVGKGVLARFIHVQSARAGAFVAVAGGELSNRSCTTSRRSDWRVHGRSTRARAFERAHNGRCSWMSCRSGRTPRRAPCAGRDEDSSPDSGGARLPLDCRWCSSEPAARGTGQQRRLAVRSALANWRVLIEIRRWRARRRRRRALVPLLDEASSVRRSGARALRPDPWSGWSRITARNVASPWVVE